jgi:hypothetical protein
MIGKGMHFRVKNLVPRFAVGFCPVHCCIGVAQNFFWRLIPGFGKGNANARRSKNFVPIQIEWLRDRQLDPNGRVFRVPRPTGNRFFRIRANIRTFLSSPRVEQERLVLPFEYRPRVFGLQSSSQPCGPFANESAAKFDAIAQTIQVSRKYFIRFFRLAYSERPEALGLAGVTEAGGEWVIKYGIVPGEASDRLARGGVTPLTEPPIQTR